MCKRHLKAAIVATAVSATIVGAATALTAAVIIVATNAHGAEWSVITPIGSKHLNTDVDYNENNYGLGVQYKDFGLLWFKNSYDNNSVAAFWSPRTQIVSGIDVGVRLGAASGYDEVGVSMSPLFGSVIPFVNPYVSVGNSEWGWLNVGVLPPVGSDGAVITFDYEYRF